jgi:hypothetical protein
MEEYILFIVKILTLQEVTITIQCNANEKPEYFDAPPNYSTDSRCKICCHKISGNEKMEVAVMLTEFACSMKLQLYMVLNQKNYA